MFTEHYAKHVYKVHYAGYIHSALYKLCLHPQLGTHTVGINEHFINCLIVHLVYNYV